jgi:hypothetical protein
LTYTPGDVGNSSEVSKFVTARVKVLVEALVRENANQKEIFKLLSTLSKLAFAGEESFKQL